MKNLLVFLMLSALAAPTMAEIVVGKINVARALTSINQGQAVRGKLEQAFSEKQKHLQSEEQKIKQMQDEFKDNAMVMSPEDKQSKRQEIQQMAMALQQKSQQFQQELAQLEQQEKGPILERMEEIIAQVSRKEGVEMTFDSSVAPIYSQKEKDLTDKIIKAYNDKYPQ